MVYNKREHQTTHWRIRPGERRFLLIAGDLTAAILALIAALYFWAQPDWLKFSLQFLLERPPAWFYLLPFVWLLLMIELYEPRRATHRDETFRGIAIAVLLILGLYLLIFFLSAPGDPLPRRGVAGFIIAVALLTLIWRMIYISIFTTPRFMRRVLIIGAGQSGSALVHIIKQSWPPPFYLVGLIDDDPQKSGEGIEGFPIICGSERLLDVIEAENITDLIFAISGELQASMFRAILQVEEHGVEVTTMPTVYEELLGRVPIFHLEADWILRSFVDQAHVNGFYELAKRLLDIAGGLIGVLVFLLLFPFISLAVILDSGFPIFFTQNRLGQRGQTYAIYKFRTMDKDSEADGVVRVTQHNDERITLVGKVLRKTHLDELPQFFNVLRGEMSLTGPRAERSELVEELQQKIPFYRARLLVKPGMTGWAQINFGYAATVEDTAIKLEYDLYYIKHRNFLMDIVILLRTFGTIVGFKGQ
jgi:exopolysaccharide biosynthesis polyprenyl glycosylphosphotransferase